MLESPNTPIPLANRLWSPEAPENQKKMHYPPQEKNTGFAMNVPPKISQKRGAFWSFWALEGFTLYKGDV